MKSLNSKPHVYHLVSNDRLLGTNLPVAGAKTGFTNMAGKCIVAFFKDNKKGTCRSSFEYPPSF